MSTFTVLEIVDLALDQSQLPKNTDFRTLGKKYLKLILENLTNDDRWPFYRKNYAPQLFIPGQTEYSLPADYRRSDTIYMTQDSSGVQRGPEIVVYEQVDFDRLRPSTVSGVPAICYIDNRNKKVNFSSSPTGGTYYWKLSYFATDITIDTAGTSTDNDTLVFEDSMALVKELTKWMYEFRDDERYESKKAESLQQMRDTKINAQDHDANSIVSLASSSFRPGVRPIRGGGGGGWV